MSEHTVKERAYFERICQHITALSEFLATTPQPEAGATLEWFEFIAKVRAIQGNISNDQSFLGTMLAKLYLMQHFDLGDYDAAGKEQGAPGLDIDIRLDTGERIIGEIKTTVPYGEKDLGAQQKDSFRKDFKKLNEAQADYKFFFITNPRTLEIMQRRYFQEIPDVKIVFLAQE
jgi:hypothetical protein